jgi:hypothetical protein
MIARPRTHTGGWCESNSFRFFGVYDQRRRGRLRLATGPPPPRAPEPLPIITTSRAPALEPERSAAPVLHPIHLAHTHTSGRCESNSFRFF